ncbi:MULTISPECIES: type VI secretion system baseplate subunit TssK [unclassified Pseudoalteromonas]|jgi:type VI secretion system protein ImpJ|uniref:type VI secretion system baseplate subunit TssK n=1 Tax=unclassified Pseudoalteromonas TaxID=194690 RepID=UPI00110BDC90|nr:MULTISPECIES: type VI secretion system baseplate subunit TssK [unclassified Pseudoalteromonas]MBB1386152.1 type VI secretion system baseplate subunit TssK [Pseudoalteromonas sp. SG45-5]MBB1395451.1 type VI secretion system baseplate subunit TssK [Pseudoalteromonas sp. SG44-4]MBB1447224.1 type VI secretion system baseplate subunit TssK [Pseudoalteromonas sp. SG41-6]TMO05393.1 type VI secretion system baseplate subunit TssK [Pseudoalteromonas sp. S558]
MSDNTRVAWTEGMFLRPQHFQQSDKHIANVIKQVCSGNLADPWGILEVAIDTELLNSGQFAIEALSAITPDLLPLDMPQSTPLPEPLVVGKDVYDEIVYLAIPAFKNSGINISAPEENIVTRYKLHDLSVSDDLIGSQSQEIIQVAKTFSKLVLSSDDHSGYILLPLAKILDVSSEGRIKLDTKYIPASLQVGQCKPLVGLVREIGSMIKQRAESIAVRLCQGYAGSTSVADFIMLQTLNKYDAVFENLLTVNNLHPNVFYTRLIELAGELSTFSTVNKRVPKLPKYDHKNLGQVFSEVVNFLYQSLSHVIEQTATEIKLEQSKFGISFGALKDKSVLNSAQFVLAIKASVPHEELRKILPSQIKIGSVETIRDLVNNQIPGITISSLPTAPRQIPYHAGFHYFELNKHGEHWEKLRSSGGIAIHLSGNYPELQLSLWAIRT